jgi:DNA-directed RNA polymerase specialized sigma24 family protein
LSMQMSEAADLGPVGTDIRETAAPSSFEGFFEQERDKLYRALWLVTRNRFEAEELTQEAFVRVLERWDRVSSVEDPQGYLFMTGMNTFRTTYRRTLLAAKRTTKILPPMTRSRRSRNATKWCERSVFYRHVSAPRSS